MFFLEGIHIGVPSLNIPSTTSTPKIIGFLFLIGYTIFKTQGNVAKCPSFYFFSNFTFLTWSEKPSNKWYIILAYIILISCNYANYLANGSNFTSKHNRVLYSIFSHGESSY